MATLKDSVFGGLLTGIFFVIGVLVGGFLLYLGFKHWITTIDFKSLIIDGLLK